ncbi:MAG: hypothetical protein JWP63_5130 [Candidatus Solibacter sp.]|jgi:hypothetical protein|nr:hypothetical protein [Candidatus Solibacter sp.]
MPMGERSFSELLQDIVRNIQEILRSEIRLAKTEIGQELVKTKSAGALLGGGAVAGLFATFFALLALVYGLTRVMPDWAAALVVAVVMGVAAAIALTAGKKQLKQVHATPDKTLHSIKENVEWVQQQTK